METSHLEVRKYPRSHYWLALILLLLPLASTSLGLFSHLNRVGVLDWDAFHFLRWIVPYSLKTHGEIPWWNPWYCGGYTAIGYGEGDGNLFSPFLPLYLILPFETAMRSEVLGYAALGLVGAWFLAGRFCRDPWLRSMAAAIGFLNGRWTIQIASGHFWHLQYAWLVWGVYFFDAALENFKFRHIALTGICIALCALNGGIYPGPHLGLLLFALAATSWATNRKENPQKARSAWKAFFSSASIGFGLAAPKLLAVGDAMSKAPRHTTSGEGFGLVRFIMMMVSPKQGLFDKPIPVPDWGWWEYGIFVGVIGAVVVLIGAWPKRLSPSAKDLNRMRPTAWLFFLLGFGRRFWFMPWPFLHLFPVFSSHHVPSRFHFVAVLLLTLIGIGVIERSRFFARVRPLWIAGISLAAILNVAWVGRNTWSDVFQNELPEHIEFAKELSHSSNPVVNYTRAHPGEVYRFPSMLANVGVLNTGSITEFARRSAIPKEAPNYPGLVFLKGPNGSASPGTVRILNWTVNSIRVEVNGANRGDRLIYNMNLEEGWTANERKSVEWDGLVSTALEERSGPQIVEFRYRPRTLALGLWISALTLLGLLVKAFARKRVTSVSLNESPQLG